MERRFQLKLTQKLETFVQEYIQKEFITVVEKEFEEILTGEEKSTNQEADHHMNSRQKRASRSRRSNIQIDSKTGKIHFEHKTLRDLLKEQEMALNHSEIQDEQNEAEFDHQNIRELILQKHKNQAPSGKI